MSMYEEEEIDEKDYSFFEMWVMPEKDTLVETFMEELSKLRNPVLEKKHREIASKGDKVMGINWLGVEVLLKEAGLVKCRYSMGWVIENVVKPICAKQQCELVELFFGVEQDNCPCVAEANWFFSYTWNEPFQETLQTLRSNLFSRSDEDPLADRYYWWDMFCQNQHIVNNVQGTFDTAISQISNLAISIPNVGKPAAATRIWCLFEIMSALDKKKNVTVYTNLAASAKGEGSIPEIDAHNAEATVQEDKKMIIELVESRIEGGVEALNEAVFKALRDGLVQSLIVRRALNDARGVTKREKDEYQYLTFTELKKLTMKSKLSDSTVVKAFIRREEIIEYAQKKGIEFPTKEEVAKRKAEVKQAAKANFNANANRYARAKTSAARAADWI